ncbi:hypothetical protein [Limosilactobacillus kribbianus]|uniref:hypothetical protein n=1 Tax=Limosilactobacillus kribbianus TaxID=2982695 RepID=UPI002264E0CC|nr:hypothetical protein [Limosilactobacillus kribbianus]
MQKEHGQVTGLIWRGPDDLATYRLLKNYADQHQLTVAAAAKQLLAEALQKN